MIDRRKFLQITALVSVSVLSCKQQKEPIVSKSNRKTINVSHTQSSQHNLDYNRTVVKMFVTAYCACEKCCGRFANGLTANGYKIMPGDRFVAADKMYPFGTVMIVPGYKWANIDNSLHPAIVLDRGGAIKGNHIDVYFDTHQEALNWGVQYLDVTVFMLNRRTK